MYNQKSYMKLSNRRVNETNAIFAFPTASFFNTLQDINDKGETITGTVLKHLLLSKTLQILLLPGDTKPRHRQCRLH